MKLYPQNDKKQLSKELFLHPTNEYRGAPFWAWNGKLKKETLLEQIENFKIMGFGGFHMHVRTGMESPYLDKEFIDYIRLCVEKAKRDGMLSWLYDEDRWPSGTAGGRVTAENPEYAKKALMLTTTPYQPERPNRETGSVAGRGIESIRQDNGVLLTCFDIVLHSDGTLAEYSQIGENDPAKGTKWYAYMESATNDPWFNDHPYVDTLNPKAVQSFLKITHDTYAKELHDEFGKTIPAIFTDEPQFTPKETLSFASEQKDAFFPWTDDIAQEYETLYGESLYNVLPELVWEMPGERLSRARWRFHNMMADRFAKNYSGQIGAWCEKHGIALTGHMNGEDTLESQTQTVGDAMRNYPAFEIPGIDMLCDFHNYATAKQAQSIVRQNGKKAMLSELYGVTGWDCDFRTYKLQGDWQAALGVTVRVPHLTWMTMKGEAKRDYPATIGYQSPWWDQFSMIEDHFARLNTALTRGKAICHVAVIHPIESFWMYWGTADHTIEKRRQMDMEFATLTEGLLMAQIDFDFLCEALLPEQCTKGTFPLQVGESSYDTVIVSGSVTLRSSTLERLKDFKNNGGKVIFLGECPKYIDAEKSDAVQPLFDQSLHLPFSVQGLIDHLEENRELEIRHQDGSRADSIIYQLRQDGDAKWLFIANGKNPVCKDVEPHSVYRFSIRGIYQITYYNTLNGEITPISVSYANGKTIFEREWYMHDSMLLKLENGEGGASSWNYVKGFDWQDNAHIILHPVEVSLSEPNMLLLDMAESRVDDSDWKPLEELLRLDNAARTALGIPLRRKEVTQPYLLREEKYKHSLTLRFTIPSECEVEHPLLGIEMPELAEIWFNDEPVSTQIQGWYVDKEIKTISMPPIHIGINTLIIKMPIGRRTNLECFYLLGDFGVRINGVEKTVTAPVRKIGFGDIVSQGLPFYTGNLEYKFDIDCSDKICIRVPHWAGGLVKAYLDDEDIGNIAFSPYRIEKGHILPGKHKISLKLYGTRQNGFAQLHYTPGIYFYQSPNSWRSGGDYWRYEYQFKPMGILKSPEFYGTGEGRLSSHITDRI